MGGQLRGWICASREAAACKEAARAAAAQAVMQARHARSARELTPPCNFARLTPSPIPRLHPPSCAAASAAAAAACSAAAAAAAAAAAEALLAFVTRPSFPSLPSSLASLSGRGPPNSAGVCRRSSHTRGLVGRSLRRSKQAAARESWLAAASFHRRSCRGQDRADTRQWSHNNGSAAEQSQQSKAKGSCHGKHSL